MIYPISGFVGFYRGNPLILLIKVQTKKSGETLIFNL